MQNFYSWCVKNNIIEEGIHFEGDVNTLAVDFKKDIDIAFANKTTSKHQNHNVNVGDLIKLHTPEWFFGIDIPNRARITSEGIQSMYCGYIIHDEAIAKIFNPIKATTTKSAGNQITNKIYHIFKKGVKGKQYFVDISQHTEYKNLSLLNKKDVETMEYNCIKRYIQCLKNVYNDSLAFDYIMHPKSKSIHVNRFANKCMHLLAKDHLYTGNQLYTLTKKDKGDMYKDYIAPLSNLTAFLTKTINNNKNNNADILFAILDYVSKALIGEDKEISTFKEKILPNNNTKLQEPAQIAILLTAWIYTLLTAKHSELSSANNIRNICNKFMYGNIMLSSGDDLKSGSRRLFNSLDWIWSGDRNTNTHNSVNDNELDVYSQNYYKDIINDTSKTRLTSNTKHKNIINVLIVDDNVNRGSTVYEATEKIREELKTHFPDATIACHWLCLLLPMNDLCGNNGVWNKLQHFACKISSPILSGKTHFRKLNINTLQSLHTIVSNPQIIKDAKQNIQYTIISKINEFLASLTSEELDILIPTSNEYKNDIDTICLSMFNESANAMENSLSEKCYNFLINNIESIDTALSNKIHGMSNDVYGYQLVTFSDIGTNLLLAIWNNSYQWLIQDIANLNNKRVENIKTSINTLKQLFNNTSKHILPYNYSFDSIIDNAFGFLNIYKRKLKTQSLHDIYNKFNNDYTEQIKDKKGVVGVDVKATTQKLYNKLKTSLSNHNIKLTKQTCDIYLKNCIDITEKDRKNIKSLVDD